MRFFVTLLPIKIPLKEDFCHLRNDPSDGSYPVVTRFYNLFPFRNFRVIVVAAAVATVVVVLVFAIFMYFISFESTTNNDTIDLHS